MTTKKLGACGLCDATCAVEVELDGDEVVAICGDRQDPFSQGHVCPKAQAHRDLLRDPDRLTRPVVRERGGWRQTGWDEALQMAGDGLAEIQRRNGRDAVGLYLGTPTFQGLETTLHAYTLAGLLRTRNVFTANSVDALPRMVCSLLMYGSQAMVPVPDLDRTDHLLLVGANPAISNGSAMTAPGMRRRLREIRKRGGKVVVLDPRRTETAARADEHHAPRPGTDALALAAMAHTVLEEGLARPDRLEPMLQGMDALRDALRPWTPARVAPAVGLPEETLRRLARELAAAPRAACYGRLGTCTQEFGTLATWALDLLNLLTGNLDRVGGAMFPTPAVDLAALAQLSRQTGQFDRWRSRVGGYPEFNGELPVAALAEEMLTPGDQQLRALVCVAGNPALSLPDSKRTEQALAGLELLVCVEPYINETSRLAHVVLPPHMGLERAHYPALPLGMAVRNVARYVHPLVPAPPQTRPDWRILHDLGVHLLRGGGLAARGGARALARLGPGVAEKMLRKLIRFGPHGRGLIGKSGLTVEQVMEAPRTLDLGPLEPRLPDLLGGRRVQRAAASHLSGPAASGAPPGALVRRGGASPARAAAHLAPPGPGVQHLAGQLLIAGRPRALLAADEPRGRRRPRAAGWPARGAALRHRRPDGGAAGHRRGARGCGLSALRLGTRPPRRPAVGGRQRSRGGRQRRHRRRAGGRPLGVL